MSQTEFYDLETIDGLKECIADSRKKIEILKQQISQKRKEIEYYTKKLNDLEEAEKKKSETWAEKRKRLAEEARMRIEATKKANVDIVTKQDKMNKIKKKK